MTLQVSHRSFVLTPLRGGVGKTPCITLKYFMLTLQSDLLQHLKGTILTSQVDSLRFVGCDIPVRFVATFEGC